MIPLERHHAFELADAILRTRPGDQDAFSLSIDPDGYWEMALSQTWDATDFVQLLARHYPPGTREPFRGEDRDIGTCIRLSLEDALRGNEPWFLRDPNVPDELTLAAMRSPTSLPPLNKLVHYALPEPRKAVMWMYERAFYREYLPQSLIDYLGSAPAPKSGEKHPKGEIIDGESVDISDRKMIEHREPPAHDPGRPSAKNDIFSALDELAKEDGPLSTGKKLLSLVATRCGATIDITEGWAVRTVQRHISEWHKLRQNLCQK